MILKTHAASIARTKESPLQSRQRSLEILFALAVYPFILPGLQMPRLPAVAKELRLLAICRGHIPHVLHHFLYMFAFSGDRQPCSAQSTSCSGFTIHFYQIVKMQHFSGIA